MNPLLQSALSTLRVLAFEALRYGTLGWSLLQDTWFRLLNWTVVIPDVRPTERYFLSDPPLEFNSNYTVVPVGAVYIEEWLWKGVKKCVVRYPGDLIPTTWDISPHQQTAKCPWIWVGDRNTEIDLTQTFAKFLVPGNHITLMLVEKLIRISEHTNLVYIEYGSFEERKFPGDGLVIKANGPV
jgi:hypothetical protein